MLFSNVLAGFQKEARILAGFIEKNPPQILLSKFSAIKELQKYGYTFKNEERDRKAN